MIGFNLDRNLIVVGNVTQDRRDVLADSIPSTSTIICFGALPPEELRNRVDEFLHEDALSMDPAVQGDMLNAPTFHSKPQAWIHKVSILGMMDRYYRVMITPDTIYAVLLDPSEKMEGMTRTDFIAPHHLPADHTFPATTFQKF